MIILCFVIHPSLARHLRCIRYSSEHPLHGIVGRSSQLEPAPTKTRVAGVIPTLIQSPLRGLTRLSYQCHQWWLSLTTRPGYIAKHPTAPYLITPFLRSSHAPLPVTPVLKPLVPGDVIPYSRAHPARCQWAWAVERDCQMMSLQEEGQHLTHYP